VPATIAASTSFSVAAKPRAPNSSRSASWRGEQLLEKRFFYDPKQMAG